MANDDYEVGYRKPPKHTRFKPGQSGNPEGRPKGTKNLATDLMEELAETIPVSEGGKPKTLTKQRAMVKTLLAKALKGDPRALSLSLQQIAHLEQAHAQPPVAKPLSEEDQAILDDFVARMVGQSGRT